MIEKHHMAGRKDSSVLWIVIVALLFWAAAWKHELVLTWWRAIFK